MAEGTPKDSTQELDLELVRRVQRGDSAADKLRAFAVAQIEMGGRLHHAFGAHQAGIERDDGDAGRGYVGDGPCADLARSDARNVAAYASCRGIPGRKLAS